MCPQALEGSARTSAQAQFDDVPHRGDTACSNGYFTYAAFAGDRARAYPRFSARERRATTARARERFLANISHEALGGWATAPGGPEAWGLCFREEVVRRTSPPACAYCVASTGGLRAGRAVLRPRTDQLDYNYNYGPAGRALGVDLLAHPELVAMDGTIAFKTALVLDDRAVSKALVSRRDGGPLDPERHRRRSGATTRLGQTINIINGGIECSYAPSPAPANVQDRLRFYAYFTGRLGVTQGDSVDCGSVQHY
ncbi:MAG: chitinase [Polyangiales bacterium]